MAEAAIRPEVQELLDHFAALLGIRIAVFTPDGHGARTGLDMPCQAFCARLRALPGGEAACRAEDARRFAAAAAAGEAVAYRCHAGLDEAVLPVQVDGVLAGFVMIGQWRSCRRPPARAWWRGSGDAELTRLFHRIPFHAPARRAHVLAFVRLLVGHLVERRLVAPGAEGAVARALAELGGAHGRRLTQVQAARLAGVAPSTLSHRFRREVGTSFTAARIQTRLDQADRLLAQGASVRAAAAACGWDDPAYFSRLYRRHRGRPPSQARPGGGRTAP
jgi:AraC-like DNA-binding protein